MIRTCPIFCLGTSGNFDRGANLCFTVSGSKCCLVEKRDSYQYVPLLLSLKALLRDTSIQEPLQKLPERIHQDGKIEDFCNGTRFKSHPLFSENPHALQDHIA